MPQGKKKIISSKDQKRMQKFEETEEEEYIGRTKCETQNIWIPSVV